MEAYISQMGAQVCLPKTKGGLRVRRFIAINKALAPKLVGRIIKEQERQWANIVLKNYVMVENPMTILNTHSIQEGPAV